MPARRAVRAGGPCRGRPLRPRVHQRGAAARLLQAEVARIEGNFVLKSPVRGRRGYSTTVPKAIDVAHNGASSRSSFACLAQLGVALAERAAQRRRGASAGSRRLWQFTEGLNTADLRTAKALLSELEKEDLQQLVKEKFQGCATAAAALSPQIVRDFLRGFSCARWCIAVHRGATGAFGQGQGSSAA